MKYAKLINNFPSYAPNPILVDGSYIGNPPGSIYEAEGYKAVRFTDQPEPLGDGYYTERWTETEIEIVQGWEWVDDPNIPDEEARKLRKLIEQASVSLPDEDALDGVELFPVWKPDTDYVKGNRVREGENLYKLIPDTHHSQADWPPHLAPAIWNQIADPSIEWPEWVQPLGAHDAYPNGAKVSHNGKHWVSNIDTNVYEPGVYGWEEQ